MEGCPGSSAGKESTCNAGDLGLIPGLRRSPGGGHGHQLQYFCLENPIDRGAWWAASCKEPEATKPSTVAESYGLFACVLSTHCFSFIFTDSTLAKTQNQFLWSPMTIYFPNPIAPYWFSYKLTNTTSLT